MLVLSRFRAIQCCVLEEEKQPDAVKWWQIVVLAMIAASGAVALESWFESLNMLGWVADLVSFPIAVMTVVIPLIIFFERKKKRDA